MMPRGQVAYKITLSPLSKEMREWQERASIEELGEWWESRFKELARVIEKIKEKYPVTVLWETPLEVHIQIPTPSLPQDYREIGKEFGCEIDVEIYCPDGSEL